MRNHSETKHKYNHIHSKRDCFCKVQHKENAVVDDIYYQRIDGIVIRFAESHKNIIDYRTADICNVKRRKFQNNRKNFVGV